MYLKSITLRDWKAYAPEVTFDFPGPGKRKNVILVGAKNGYGKTSLLEAIIFGLYGRDAMPLVARAEQGGDEARAKVNYSDFLERAFHARAVSESRTTMSVKLDFEGDPNEGELEYFSVERKWNFSSSGRHIADRDEICVVTSPGFTRQRPGKLDDEDDYYRGMIARNTLPSYLAQFFLFDGERVQNLARRDMKSQVRLGIEGLLGASVLRELADDLGEYSKWKLQSVASTGSEALKALGAELERLKAALQHEEGTKADCESKIAGLNAHRDELFQHLRGGAGGAIANVRALEEERARLKLEVNQHKDHLAELLVNEFSLALAGQPVRDSLRKQLEAEQRLAKWKGSLATTAGKVDQFVEAIDAAEPGFVPPLEDVQKETLRRKVKAAWETLWHPPPSDCASCERHPYLGDTEKAIVLSRIEEVEKLGQDAVEELLHKLDSAERDLRRVEQQIAEFAGIEDSLQRVTDELDKVGKNLTELEKARGDHERQAEALSGQVGAKEAEYRHAARDYAEARPVIARATVADSIAEMLAKFLADAIQGQVTDIAAKMTEAFREMAHKQVVERIVIDPDCNVQLLSRNGKDIRGFDPSAGENQIFSFALISAIAQAAEIRFPIIIDTPLARLDRDHRLNVLRHFTERAGEQIVLLSQNKEVVGEELDAIRTRVAQTYLVETEVVTAGVGRSHVTPNRYFEAIR